MNSKSSLPPTKKVARIRNTVKSEERKEKMREDARHRRSKEAETISELADLLPLPNNLIPQLNQGSVMRLTIAFLKVKSLLDSSDHGLFGMWNDDDECSLTDPCWSQALGGILLALSSEGEIIYLTENVTHHLGLHQVDLIGKSIYDYCHTDDQNRLRQILSLRPDGDLTRSFLLRIKPNCNPNTTNYKVMNFSGRIVRVSSSNLRIQNLLEGIFKKSNELTENHLELTVKSTTSHFLVVVGEPIPRPSNMKMSLDSDTFITNTTLDMQFTYVSETIIQFLGYKPEDLIGRSMYEFHHAEESEHIMKSYKTMFDKGQTQTLPYRFMGKYGGYAWVQTQATLVSVRRCNEIVKSQAAVCVHTVLSEIEEPDHILCISQAEASAAGRFNIRCKRRCVLQSLNDPGP